MRQTILINKEHNQDYFEILILDFCDHLCLFIGKEESFVI